MAPSRSPYGQHRFLWPLALLAVLAIANSLALFVHTRAMEQDATVVNLAGRQRMLATRLGFEAEALVAEAHHPGRLRYARQRLAATAEEMAQQHRALTDGDSRFLAVPEVRALLTGGGADENTRHLIEAAQRLAAASDPEDHPDSRLIAGLWPMVVEQTDRAVRAFEARSTRQMRMLAAFELGALLITLLSLAFVAVRVFRPMARRIRNDFERVEKTRAELDAARQQLAERMAALDQADAESRRHRDRLHAILEAADQGICGLDPKGDIRFVNRTATALLHRDEAELLGQAFARVTGVNPATVARDGRVQLSRADGRRLLVTMTVSPLPMENGVGRVVLFADAEERQRQEQTLMRERNFVAAVLDTIGSLVTVLDRDGRIVRFNRRCEQLSGYRYAEVAGRLIWELLIPPEERIPMRRAFQDLVAGHFPSEHRGRWMTRNGERRLIAWSNSCLCATDGSVEFVITTGLDVTENEGLVRALGDTERKYRNLMDHASDAIVLIDAAGRLTEVNQATLTLTGYTPLELIGRHFTDFLDPSVHKRAATAFNQTMAEGQGALADAPLRTRSGELRWIDATASWVTYGGGTMQAMVRDITERKQQQESLALAARVFEASGDGILVTDTQNRIVQVNRAFEEITGYSPAEALGQTPRLLHSGRHDSEFYRALWQSLEQNGRWQGEIWNRRKDGAIYPEWVTIDAVRDEQGTAHHYVAVFRDISASKRQEEDLRRLANFDPLTHLPNRSLFQDRLRQAISQASRGQSRFGLMLLDLDRFKQINDTLGHQVGDQLLQEAAERLRGCVRESDTVARLGGDEFTVILHQLEQPNDANPIARKIIAAMSRPFRLKGEDHHIATSIGISIYPDTAGDPDTLLRQADVAMYAAKRAGGGGFRFHSEELERAS